MVTWDSVCEALDIDADEVVGGASITRRALYRMNSRIFVPVVLPKFVPPKAKKLYTMTPEETKLLNMTIFDKLMAKDPVAEKAAIDAVNDFTRMKLKEEGLFRKIMPPMPISDCELDKSVQTSGKPILFADLAYVHKPADKAAISIPFGTLPVNMYISSKQTSVNVAAGTITESVQLALADAKDLTEKATTVEEKRVARSFWDSYRRHRRRVSCPE